MRALQDAGTTTSLRDKVAERVRSDIVSGRRGPGAMYSVPTLAGELGVSTTPVREALLELSRSGLLAPMRNRGFRVEEPTLEDLRNMLALRELLERFAMVRLAEQRLTDTAPLRELADDVAAAVRQGDTLGYLETDRAFHLELIARAGNPFLTKFVQELRDGMRLYGMESPAGRQCQIASVAEHYQLIELAASGERERVATLITQHITSWEPVFTAGLERSNRPLHGKGR